MRREIERSVTHVAERVTQYALVMAGRDPAIAKSTEGHSQSSWRCAGPVPGSRPGTRMTVV
jgi:hypothetical protein